jgi:hypothetical protein
MKKINLLGKILLLIVLFSGTLGLGNVKAASTQRVQSQDSVCVNILGVIVCIRLP